MRDILDEIGFSCGCLLPMFTVSPLEKAGYLSPPTPKRPAVFKRGARQGGEVRRQPLALTPPIHLFDVLSG